MQQCLDGWRKGDPATEKKLPVEADIPDCILLWGRMRGASQREKCVGFLCVMAFYYLLRIGEYTMKARRMETQQTVPFLMEDVALFDENDRGKMRRIPHNASARRILMCKGAALRIQN